MNIKELAEKYIKQKSVIIGVSALLSIAVLVIVFSLVSAFFAGRKDSKAPGRYLVRDDDLLPDYRIESSDLIIPEEYTRLPEFRWIQYRKVKEKWTEEEVDRFWIEPAEIVKDIYSGINEENFKNILKEIP